MKMLFKIAGKVFLGLIVLFISVMLVFAWFAKANSKKHGDNAKTLKSDKMNAKKALVVYQPSRGKLTRKIAEEIAKGINAAGYEVTINYPGEHMDKDISKYSIVVFGSPVYMGQTSSVLADYMKSIKNISNEKILLFATGGQLSNGEIDKMEQQLGSRKATEKVGFKSGKEEETKAYEIGKRIAENK